MKDKNTVIVHVNVDTKEIDNALKKVRYLKQQLQELKTSIDELNSALAEITLKISVEKGKGGEKACFK